MFLPEQLLMIRDQSSSIESLPGGITRYTITDAPDTVARVFAGVLSVGLSEFSPYAATTERYYYYYGDLYLGQTNNQAAETANIKGVELCARGDFVGAEKLFNAAYQACTNGYANEHTFLNSKQSIEIAINGQRLLNANKYSDAEREFQRAYDLSCVQGVYSIISTYRETSAREAARLAAEQRAREEAARLAAEQRAREEAARLAAEQRAREEAARLAAEQRAREEAARLAAEQKAREEAVRLAAEQRAREEAARLAAEQKAREEAVRLAAEQRAREEAARLAAEQRAREEAARLAAEQKAREEAVRLAAEQRAREEAARLAAEQRAREEAARLAAEQRAREEATNQALNEAPCVDETNTNINLQGSASPEVEKESLQGNATSMRASRTSARWTFLATHFTRGKTAPNIINRWKEIAEALKLNRQGLQLFSEGKFMEAATEIESALEKYEEAVSKFNEAAAKQPLDAIFNSFIKVIDAFINNKAFDEAAQTINYAKGHFPDKSHAFLDAEKMIEEDCWYPDYVNTYLIQLDLEALENNIKEQSDGY